MKSERPYAIKLYGRSHQLDRWLRRNLTEVYSLEETRDWRKCAEKLLTGEEDYKSFGNFCSLGRQQKIRSLDWRLTVSSL